MNKFTATVYSFLTGKPRPYTRREEFIYFNGYAHGIADERKRLLKKQAKIPITSPRQKATIRKQGEAYKKVLSENTKQIPLYSAIELNDTWLNSKPNIEEVFDLNKNTVEMWGVIGLEELARVKLT
jgi:hypothetical protein